MPRYSVNNTTAGSQQNLSSAFKTMVAVSAVTGATTLRRGWIDEIIVGADGTLNSTNCQVLWDWSKFTAVGTAGAAGVATSPEADAAALLVYGVNYPTTEPTYTASASLLAFPTNQQQSQRWFANQAPNQTQPLVVPAITVNGVGGRAKSPTYVSTVQMQEYVIE